MAAITDREKALSDSVKVEYEAVQRETFNQRQQLLQQTEQLRHRETEIRDEKAHVARYDVISCWCCESLLESKIFTVSDEESRYGAVID